MIKQQQYDGLFQSARHEEVFFKRYRALADQLGVENVTICLPQHWASDYANYTDQMKLEFSTVTEIKIKAVCDFITIEESAPLFEFKPTRRPDLKFRLAA